MLMKDDDETEENDSYEKKLASAQIGLRMGRRRYRMCCRFTGVGDADLGG